MASCKAAEGREMQSVALEYMRSRGLIGLESLELSLIDLVDRCFDHMEEEQYNQDETDDTLLPWMDDASSSRPTHESDRLSLSQSQLSFIRSIMISWKQWKENERLDMDPQRHPYKPLPAFSDQFVLSRASSFAKSFALPPQLSTDKKQLQDGLAMRKMARKLTNTKKQEGIREIDVENGIEMEEFEAMPDIDDALDLRISATRDQMQYLKSMVLNDRKMRKQGSSDSAHDSLVTTYTPDILTRSHSPPIFSRPISTPAAAIMPIQDIVSARLDESLNNRKECEASSSPGGERFEMKEWNKLEYIQPFPSSSSEQIHLDRPIWSSPYRFSSPATNAPPLNDMIIEQPLFPRIPIKVEEEEEPGFYAQVSLPIYHNPSLYLGQDIDELDENFDELDEEDDSLMTFSAARISDEMCGAIQIRLEDVGKPLLVDARLEIPQLPVAPASIPLCLSGFSSDSTTIWSLKKPTGLRSLMLDLEWQPWSMVADEGLHDVLVGDETSTEYVARFEEARAVQTRFRDQLKQKEEEQDATELDIDLASNNAQDLTKHYSLLTDDDSEPELISRCDRLQHPLVQPQLNSSKEESEGVAAVGDSTTFDISTLVVSLEESVCFTSSPHQQLDPASPIRSSPQRAAIGNSTPSILTASPSIRDDSGVDGGIQSGSINHMQVKHLSAETVTCAVEVALPESRWTKAGALASFLASRGHVVVAPPPAVPASVKLPVIPSPSISRTPTASVRPLPSLPFAIPSYVRQSAIHQPSDPASLDLIRIISSSQLLQIPLIYHALLAQSLLPIDRPSPARRFRILVPHLIVDGQTGVVILPLLKIIGNVVRISDDDESMELKRQEAVISTLKRLARSFERIILIFQEHSDLPSTGGYHSRGSCYTPPVLASLAQLDEAIFEAKMKVDVVFSAGARESARIVRCLVEELRDISSALGDWDDRLWITDDPTEDETNLCQLDSLNPFTACKILSHCDIQRFVVLSKSDRRNRFGQLCGFEKIDKISDYLAMQSAEKEEEESSVHASSPSPSFQYLSLSAIGLQGSVDDVDDMQGEILDADFEDFDWDGVY